MIGRVRRLSERHWDALDRGLAGLVFVAIVVDLALNRWHGPLVLDVLIAAWIATALLWRRKHPLLVAAAVLAGAAGLLITLTSPKDATSLVIVVIIASYSTGAHLNLRRAIAGFVVTVGAIAAVCIVKTPNDVFFPVVFFGIVPWALGRVIRNQTALARELTEKAEREQIAREEEEARATVAERARVARELHDVLAHNLSVMVIQASAAGRIVERDPAAAVEAAQLISRTGRETLNELRYVFGPVRKQDGEALGAAPGLANIEHLASRAHRAGLPVEVYVKGKPLELSPGVDLTAYRVVQEALTNALKHARGSRATVTVHYEPREVVVEVLDNGAGTAGNGTAVDSGGHGLVGMRERVALYGGKLEASKRDSGFAVRARLPAGERPA
ncbi:MAG: sensor histidine kinase [Solirubrobacteraceae bacterium]